MNKNHGSPWDRGGADAWYGRPACPHKWLDGYKTVPLIDFSEVCDYMSGYMAGPFAEKRWD